MTFKAFLKKGKFGEDNPLTDFVEDCDRDRDFQSHRNFITWPELENYLTFKHACSGALKSAKKIFKMWQQQERAVRELRKPELVDDLNNADIAKIKKALRQVWSWSYSRRLVVNRCTTTQGYSRCEKCLKRCPKIHIDHITPVGSFDGGYIERLFVPSTALQGLCAICHKAKTKIDLAEIRRIKTEADFF